MWVVEDGADLAQTLVRRLAAAGTPARAIAAKAVENADASRCAGLVLLGSPAEADVWSKRSEKQMKVAFGLTKRLAGELRRAADEGGALFATVARMDGAFGLLGGSFDPLAGALAGLAKTVAHEWPTVRCRALDVAISWTDAEAAADAIAHELAANGPFEVGLDGRVRRGLKLVPAPVNEGELCIAEGDVVLVTGGARGVTAETALALAESAKPTLVLLGRSAPPTPEPEYLVGVEGEAAIKQALLDHAFNGTKHPTPAELQAAYHRHTANREIAANLARMQAAGAQVSYRSVDVRDAKAVRSLCADIRKKTGPIRGLIHAAGVIEDRLIDDKTQEQFDAVFDTKVAGPAHAARRGRSRRSEVPRALLVGERTLRPARGRSITPWRTRR